MESLKRRLGSHFTLLEIQGFDEIFAALGTELEGEDRYAAGSIVHTVVGPAKAFDERLLAGASLDDLDLDLALSVMQEYCRKLQRAPVTRDTLYSLMREQGLLIQENGADSISNGAMLLFGKQPQAVFPHAVISLTEGGKKREIYDGNLISQHRKLLARLEDDDVNPPLKVKGRRGHKERRPYPPRVLLELLVNMLVHRDYEIPVSAEIESWPGVRITFENPGGLTAHIARRVRVDQDGRFTLSEKLSDQRNPSLCDIFFGLSAMERAGTGLLDVGTLMTGSGGGASFFHLEQKARFCAQVAQPVSSGGSLSVARSDLPTGLYVLNAIPFLVIPEHVSIIRLKVPFSERPKELDLKNAGTFIQRDIELWSFAPLDHMKNVLAPIVDASASRQVHRGELEEDSNSRRVLSWLLRKHWERHVLSFSDEGLMLEDGRRHRAYFVGIDRGPRSVKWNSAQRRGIKREVVKRRGEDKQTWFENEGFGYEIVTIDGNWCVRIQPFYMFTGRDSMTPLAAFTRTSKATRRIKFDRNKNVEADLNFWSTFLARQGDTINIGQEHVSELILGSSFMTVEIPESGLLEADSGNQDRMLA